MKTIAQRLSITSATLLLAACGGGGGSALGSQQPTAVELTVANGQAVAASVAQAFAAAGSLADLNLSFTLTDVSALSASGGPATRLGGGVAHSAGRLVRLSVAGPTPNLVTTDNCLVAGTIQVTSVIASPGTLTANDTVTAVYANCDDGDGQVLDGTLGLRVQAFTGNLGTGFFTLTAAATFGQLSATSGSDAAAFDGDATLAIDTTDPVLLDSTVSGSSLKVTLNGETATLSNYAVTTSTDITNPNDFDESLEAVGTITSAALGGRIDLDTIAPLLQRDSETAPRSGQFTITGAGGSHVDVTVTTGGAVTLDIDDNGDNVVDDTINTTWAALFN